MRVLAESTKSLGFRVDEDSAIRARLDRLHQESLERVVVSVAKKHGIALEEAARLRAEFLRFVALIMVTGESLAPAPAIDDFWHEFIVHTRSYSEFCDRHLGRFLHHEPDTEGDSSGRSRFRRTLELLQEHCPGADLSLWSGVADCSVGDAPGSWCKSASS